MKTILLTVLLTAVCGYVHAQTPAPEPAVQAATEATKTTLAPAPEIKILKMVTASSVENKKPVNESSVFDNNVGRVYTWTRLATSAAPVKIKHVYYCNGRKLAEVELEVNAKAYRVWSAKKVWAGDWKVEATDEAGAVLATVTFTVSNTAPARKTPEAEAPTQGK